MAVIVETAMAEDLDLGTSDTEKTHPGGGKVPGHQISISTFATVGASGTGHTDTWDPGAIASASSASTTITVPGAALGDFVMTSFSLSLQGLMMNGDVSAANTVTVKIYNNTGGSVNLASGTIKVLVFKAR